VVAPTRRFTTASPAPTRPSSLRFADLDDLREHLAALDGAALMTTGAWTAGQILYHLAAAFEVTCERPDATRPRPGRLATLPQRALALRVGLPRGVPIPADVRAAVEPPPEADEAEQLARLRRAIDRFEARRGGFPAHRMLGPLTRDEWRQFHLRHCELHLGHIATGRV
jgi:hypothetical protein